MENISQSEIDWTIIPENRYTPILDKDMMNIDSQLDEWENVVEDDVVDNTATRHAALQTPYCASSLFSYIFFALLNFNVVHLVVGDRKTCRVHGFYDAMLQRGNGPPLCRPLSIRILNGNPPGSRLALRLDPTTFGRYLYCV